MSQQSRKAKIKQYLKQGLRENAVRYTMEAYQVTETEAVKLVDALEPEIAKTRRAKTFHTSATPFGCAGCLGVVMKMASVVFMFFGVVLIIGVVIIYYIIDQEKKELVELEAVIIEFHEKNLKLYPVVEYEWDAVKLTDTMGFPVEQGEYLIGQQVIVFIHPNDPRQAYLEQDLTISFIDTFLDDDMDDVNNIETLELIRGGIFFILLIPGLIFIIMSIVFWVLSNRLVRPKSLTKSVQ